MKLILNNPYRILGLLVGATAKEQERQTKRLRQFIEAEQEPEQDFSIQTLGHIHRTLESVNDASSKLNLDSDKMNAALFWFYKGNPTTDEPAFDALKASDLDQAQNIWKKLTSNTEVTQRNASAYNNLGTLYLSGILEGQNTNESLLEKGISLKLKFLESDFVKDFKALATDETFKTTKIKLQLLFLNQLQTEVEKNKYVSLSHFLEILTQQEFSAKEGFLKEFVQKPIEQIEKKIEDAKAKHKANAANALNIGKNLIEETSENLTQIKSIVGESNFKFSSISDKVSEEILQCGIDYFKFHKDKNGSGLQATLDEDVTNIFKTAHSIAVGSILKQRCLDNLKTLTEWIKDKPKREKEELIKEELDTLNRLLKPLNYNTIGNAWAIVNQSKPCLGRIKNRLGETDDLYLKISTGVAAKAQSNIIKEVNQEQEFFVKNYTSVYELKSIITKAWEVTILIGGLDMENDYKTTQYDRNKASLRLLCKQLDIDVESFEKQTTNVSETSKKHEIISNPKLKILSEIIIEEMSGRGIIIGIYSAIIGIIMGAFMETERKMDQKIVVGGIVLSITSIVSLITFQYLKKLGYPTFFNYSVSIISILSMIFLIWNIEGFIALGKISVFLLMLFVVSKYGNLKNGK